MRRLILTLAAIAWTLTGHATERTAAPCPTNTVAKPAPAKLTDEERAKREAERLKKQEDDCNNVWATFSLQEKQRCLDWYRALSILPPAELKTIRERIDQYQRMSREERIQLEKNNERWSKMTPAERERARQEYLRLRYEYETKWRKENPHEPPPPFRLTFPLPSATTNTPPTKAKTPSPTPPDPS